MSDEQIYWPRPKSSSGRSCLSEMEDSDEQSSCFGCKRTKKSTRYVCVRGLIFIKFIYIAM